MSTFRPLAPALCLMFALTACTEADAPEPAAAPDTTRSTSAAGSTPADGSAVSAKDVCAYLDGQVPTLKGIGSETGAMANLTVNLYSWYEKQGPVPNGRDIDDQTRKECPATRTEVLKLAGMESFERL
ncbi:MULTISPECIES: hypothetical protein [Micromonospora]|uniref:hypothetical protein n=1 Tax=Micromonospora TaxID=1873 RepID=UPI001EE90346|nr:MULTISPECIES: hypothetical protein [Micromonospora]MCG5450952.1 hypothetical protein [Micromonospora hortensis]MCX5119433.1 hypothetical protein [Micromonospora sp. NBC_00362]